MVLFLSLLKQSFIFHTHVYDKTGLMPNPLSATSITLLYVTQKPKKCPLQLIEFCTSPLNIASASASSLLYRLCISNMFYHNCNEQKRSFLI